MPGPLLKYAHYIEWWRKLLVIVYLNLSPGLPSEVKYLTPDPAGLRGARIEEEMT